MKKRLGRGLSSMIAEGAKSPATARTKAPKVKSEVATLKAARSQSASPLPPAEGFTVIAVDRIEPNPYQPRKAIDPSAIEELAESIRAEGLLQPIIVRKNSSGSKSAYELIAGERRWRAFQYLKLKTIPARLIKASDAAAAVIALVENLQREDLDPIEEALGFASLMRDFDLTQEAVAERVGKGRATISNALRLLQLEPVIQGYLAKGLISVGHAKALLGLGKGSQEQRLQLAENVIKNGLSVRQTEAATQRFKNGNVVTVAKRSRLPRSSTTRAETLAIKDLEKRLSSHLEAEVQLNHSARKGKLVVQYYGQEDLQRILDKIGLV